MSSRVYQFIECPVTDDRGHRIDVVRRPIIDITLSLDDRSRPFYGVVDTGSDLCIFPAWMARFLGHNLTLGKKREIKGFCGTAVAYKHTTFISVFDTGFRCDSYYSPAADNLGFGILGLSCLAKFNIEFRYPEFFKITERPTVE